MSSVRYCVDEHIASAIVHSLRQRGVDVMTVIDAGTIGGTDEIHVAFALNASATIFTQDSDFLRLAAIGVRHAGIAYARQRTPIGKIVAGLLLIHNGFSAEEMMNSIVYL